MFGFRLQGDKGQPGLPGDQGGKGQKVLALFLSVKGFVSYPQISIFLCCFLGFQGFAWAHWKSRLNWRKG